MAEAAKTATKKAEALPPETEKVGEHTLVHAGHGKYTVEGHAKQFSSRAAALNYLEDLKAAAAHEETFGDIVPEGVEITDRILIYRGTLLDHPMNEHYLPDGTHSPYYDRAWAWGWGRAEGPDIAMKQAKGWRAVTRDELEAEVVDGRVPEHYRTMLLPVAHGARMQYGDLVIMRVPRVLRRQHQANKEEAALRRIKRQDAVSNEFFEKAGVKNTSGPVTNEVSAGLKISGL